jgi:hypothetical protein
MMTIDDLISLDRQAFIATIASLDDDECEIHVRGLLKHLQGPSFEEYVWALSGSIVADPTDLDRYYQVTAELIPGIPREDDVLGRLCGLALKMMVDRIERHKDKLRTSV